MKKTKVIFFVFFLSICSIEQLIHYANLITGKQPHREFLPTYFLELQAASLVFDRIRTFLPSTYVELTFEDGSKKEFNYSEREENPNWLEIILIRRAFTSLASDKLIHYYFCEHNIKTMGPGPWKTVKEVDVLNRENNQFFHYVCKDLKI